MPSAAELYPRGAPTRAAILVAAEETFAEKGFDGARLTEIADNVGVQRPAISYYFRDKGALYEAVLERLFGDLFEQTRALLERPAPILDRVEAAVGAWVDFVGARPALAPILLREVAAGQGGRISQIARHVEPFIELVTRLETESEHDLLADDGPVDPARFASTIAGATLFFVAAIPVLAPGSGFDPLDAETLAGHKTEALRLTRRLLGIRAVPRTPQATKEIRRPTKRAGPGGSHEE